jgi:hypothetical protein
MKEKKTYDHNYPSDITREQYEIVRSLLEGARTVTKPRYYDLYDILCAILYLVKSGCQWRMIPSDFPPKGIVRYYYDIWANDDNNEGSILEGVLKKIKSNDQERGHTQR